MPTNHSAPRWSPETKRWAILGMAIVLGTLIYYARSALAWLVVASLLAYLLQPIVNWLDEHNMPRAMAAGLALLLAVAILVIIPIVLLPMLIQQFTLLAESLVKATIHGIELFNQWMTHSGIISIFGFNIDLRTVIEEIGQKIIPSLGAGGESGSFVPTLEDLINYLQQAIATAGGFLTSIGGWLTSLVTRAVSVAFSFLLMLFYTYFITVDGRKLRPWVQSLFKPEYQPELSELGHRINRVWQSFFRGQLTLSLVIGGITLVVGLIIGLPSAFALAIIAGVMEAVPTLGPVIAAIPAVIMAFTQGSSVLPVSNLTFALITLGAYILIQQLENMLIVPRVMGSALELHPMVVLVGVVIGASFAGVLGIFLAAPSLATLKVVLNYTHAKILDVDPYPISYEEERAARVRDRGPTLFNRLASRSRALAAKISRDDEPTPKA